MWFVCTINQLFIGYLGFFSTSTQELANKKSYFSGANQDFREVVEHKMILFLLVTLRAKSKQPERRMLWHEQECVDFHYSRKSRQQLKTLMMSFCWPLWKFDEKKCRNAFCNGFMPAIYKSSRRALWNLFIPKWHTLLNWARINIDLFYHSLC